jgi:hypothetical protein
VIQRRSAAPALALAILATGTLSCVSYMRVLPERRPASCAVDPALFGVWSSRRASQLGPARMTLRFNCDCSYRAWATALMALRLREDGYYRVDGDRVVMMRANGGETRWRYRLVDAGLEVEEAPGELYLYQRRSPIDCGPPRAAC